MNSETFLFDVAGKVDTQVPTSQLFTKAYIERQKQRQQTLKPSKATSLSSTEQESSPQEIELDLIASTVKLLTFYEWFY